MKKILMLSALLAFSLPTLANEKVIELYKSASCGCCSQWGEALEKLGYQVNSHNLTDIELNKRKDSLAVPDNLRSCHTATLGKWVLEGHVPVDAIQRLQDDSYGLATPGMPVGSLGMEQGEQKESYDVIAFSADGTQKVAQRYH